MSISTSSAISTVASATANLASNPGRTQQPQPQQSQPAPNNSGYTVQLSEAQQVYQLYNQGQQVSQIAATLNLSVSAVNNYLGITNSNSSGGS